MLVAPCTRAPGTRELLSREAEVAKERLRDLCPLAPERKVPAIVEGRPIGIPGVVLVRETQVQVSRREVRE